MASYDRKTGKGNFRHPVVTDPSGYGKVVGFGLSKFSGQQAERIIADLEELVKIAPRLRDQVADRRFEPPALDIYFRPLEKPSKAELARRSEIRSLVERTEQDTEDASDREFELIKREEETALFRNNPSLDPLDPDYEDLFAKALGRIATLVLDVRFLTEKVNLKTKEVQERDLQIEAIAKASGEQLGGKRRITLSECVDHFEKNVVCKTERAKSDLMRRVRTVVGNIGEGRLHSEIVIRDVVDACKKNVSNANEEKYRLRDIKRFFKTLSFDRASGGLGLPDPSLAIKPGTPTPGLNETLDPVPLLGDKALSPYWKMLVAALGLAGMRLSEAASLEWGMLDEKEGIVRLRASRQYPSLKNSVSERDIKPFEQFWECVREYRKVARHSRFLFDRTVNGEQTDWFEDREGKKVAVNLPGAFREALEEATGRTFEEPSRRLRRFWETEMRKRGLSSLVSASSGHSDKVGRRHYEKHADTVRAAKVGRL